MDANVGWRQAGDERPQPQSGRRRHGHDQRLVVHLGRDADEDERHGMLARIAAFEVRRRIVASVREGAVPVSRAHVGVRAGPVMVIRVSVTGEAVDVLRHRRSKDRRQSQSQNRSQGPPHAVSLRSERADVKRGRTKLVQRKDQLKRGGGSRTGSSLDEGGQRPCRDLPGTLEGEPSSVPERAVPTSRRRHLP